MRLLLDTHVILWGLSAPRRLPPEVLARIRSADTDSYVSVASLWEIAIKAKSGKLNAPIDLPQQIADDPDFDLLPVLAEHAWRVRTLPRLHGDPFDHLLIAQTIIEGLTLVTHDPAMAAYGIPILAV